MEIATREQLRALKRPEKTIAITDGDGNSLNVVVQGFSLDQIEDIRTASARIGPDGSLLHYDTKTDTKLSFIAAVKEPKLSLIEDGEWISGLPHDVVSQVIETARALGARSQDQYQALKQYLRENAYVARLYSVCAQVFHRFPSELDHITELEFNAALAAIEIEAESVEAKVKQKSNG